MRKMSKIILSLVLTLSLLHLFDLGQANAEGTTKHDEIDIKKPKKQQRM